METKITRASNGRGIAAQSTVEIIRAPGNMILDVTSTQNFPGVNEDNTVSGEIFHFGCWSADGGGVLVPGTLVEGKAHVSNIGEVTIDSLDPGFTDKGNNIGDIFMVKPTTGWANDMVEALQATLNPDGTLKDNSVTTAAVANNAITASKVDFTTGIWWEELGRAKQAAAGALNLVVNIPAEKRKKYYKILATVEREPTPGGFLWPFIIINNDARSKYSTMALTYSRGSEMMAQDSLMYNAGEVQTEPYQVCTIQTEVSDLGINSYKAFQTRGAGSSYYKTGGGWYELTAQITSFSLIQGEAAWSSRCEIIVLGHN